MKRPWTRSEKSLFISPLLFLSLAGGVWLWNTSQPPTIIVEGVDDVNHLQFSPDGKQLVGFFAASKGTTRFGKVFDVENRSNICDLEVPQPLALPTTSYPNGKRYFLPYAPYWSPDGTQIVSGYTDNLSGPSRVQTPDSGDAVDRPNKIDKFAIWDAKSGEINGDYLYAPINEDSRSRNVRFSEDGKNLIGDGKPPTLFAANTGKRLQVWKGKLEQPTLMKANFDLGIVAEQSSSPQNYFWIVDSRTKRSISKLKVGHLLGHSEWKDDILGTIVLDADKSEHLMLWSGSSRKSLPSPPVPKSGVIYDFHFNPVNKTLVYTMLDEPGISKHCELVAWDYGRHRELWRQSVPTKALSPYYKWSPDGKWLSATTSSASDKRGEKMAYFYLYDHTGKLRLKRDVFSTAHAWSPDSKKLAVTNKRGQDVEIEFISIAD
jgi:hypothetical protein